MRDLLDRVRAFWDALQPREQILVGLAGGALVVTLVFLGLVLPIQSARERAADASDEQLVQRAQNALGTFIGAQGEPTAVSVARWPRAIPQYPPGHTQKVERLRSRLSALVGLHVAGNWLQGVGLEAAVASGDQAVADALEVEWTATLE